MTSYGQFCPVAKAMELLDERWTMLVVRELLAGSTHFNDLRRGNPKMSPALLSKRLRTLERAGLVRREVHEGRSNYTLTPCGEELREIVGALGAWGVRWVGQLGEEDLDPHLLMWDIRRTVPLDQWPRDRTVVAFEFDDVPPRVARWWLCVTGDEPDVCDNDPGFEVSATLNTTLRTLTEIWRGDRDWSRALKNELVAVSGPGARDVPRWLGQMTLAAVARPA
ncbi:helix-turn-helix domain-containing protein [Nocardioides sp.]|uniref:winged helix-turn-helix transcriptional regulator n=1 Tax=Nocardioides sp. TaxID=35761 RepID=UPI0031FF1707|nr:DNA-binding transcriptional regulator, HxlR family [Nocardioides sp.]